MLKALRLRGPILGMGGAQVLGTGLVIGAAGWGIGIPWNQALAAGLILAMSSTAIVLQSLAEKGQLNSQAGRSSSVSLTFIRIPDASTSYWMRRRTSVCNSRK